MSETDGTTLRYPLRSHAAYQLLVSTPVCRYCFGADGLTFQSYFIPAPGGLFQHHTFLVSILVVRAKF